MTQQEAAMEVDEDLSILEQIPNEKLLKDLVVSRIAYKWHDIGVQLGIGLNDLERIDRNHKPLDVEECCEKMLFKWKSKRMEVTGANLIHAIQSNDNARYATELNQEMTKYGEDKILSDAYIQSKIVPIIATEWEEIALDIGLQKHETDRIKQLCDPSRKKCTAMLDLWLNRGSGSATWRKIYDAMRALELNRDAENLKDDLKQSTVPN